MNSNTIKGNNTGGVANVADLTTAQVAAILPAFTGDSGAGGVQGLVPAPPAGSAAANKVLGAGGSWVANGTGVTNVATGQCLTGGPITTTGTISVPNNGVTNACLGTMVAHSYKGNNTGSTGTPIDLTQSQLTAELLAFTGDSGAGGVKGMVPPPAAGDAAANKVLGAGGGWVVQSGGGGSALTVTDGTHSVTSTSSITAGNGFVVGGSAGAATLNLTVADPACKTTNYTIAATDMGNSVNLCATSGTPTFGLPAVSSTIFATGMTVSFANTGTVTWTLSNSSTLTLSGFSGTSILPGTQGTFVANADGTHLDFFGVQIGLSGSTLPLLNNANDWSGAAQTLGTVFAKLNTQTGTTYTVASTDCGKTVKITNAAAITVTVPNSITQVCHIAIVQGGAGQITVTAGAGATLTNPHGFTKTFAQSAGIGVSNIGATAADWLLFGDGA